MNQDHFISDYSNIDWDEVIDINKNDVNFSMESFLSKFNVLLDVHMPLKKITHRQFKQKQKPWISNLILAKIYEKNKILRKYIKCIS